MDFADKIDDAMQDVDDRVVEVQEQIDDADYEGALDTLTTLRDELDTLANALRRALR